MMLDSRSFSTTRGKVLVLLKKRGSCTVAYLSEQLQLTRNAIRQHLSALERDNLVSQQLVKTGPTRPSLSYSLTPQGESLFPKRYDRLLADLVQELVLQRSCQGMERLLSRLGHSAAGGYLNRVSGIERTGRFPTSILKVAEVSRILEEEGAIVEWQQVDREVLLRDFNCPYAALVKAYPPVCLVQSNFLQRLLEPARVEAVCDREEARCCFRIRFSSNDT